MNAGFNGALAKQRQGGEWEDAGYIYHQLGTGNYYYDDLGDLQLVNGQVQIPNPPSYSGWQLVGWYHTHPDTYNWANGNGMAINGTHFSPPDIQTTSQLGVPGYVSEYNDVGVQSDDPNTMYAEESFQWYSTNATPIPNTNPQKYTETPKGGLSSGSGC